MAAAAACYCGVGVVVGITPFFPLFLPSEKREPQSCVPVPQGLEVGGEDAGVFCGFVLGWLGGDGFIKITK